MAKDWHANLKDYGRTRPRKRAGAGP